MIEYAKQFAEYVDLTQEARDEAELARDYYDSRQWTSAQAAILKQRGQAAVVLNRIAPKMDFLFGVEKTNRTDPKAYPRTPEHNQDAEAATDALRYVNDRERLDEHFSNAFEELCIEGTAAIAVDVEEKRGRIELKVEQIHWDRFYFDPRSREKDFSDAQFLGVSVWMDAEDAKRLFPGKGQDIDGLVNTHISDEAHADRPELWADSARKRVRVCRHCYRKSGKWWVVYFSADTVLRKAQPSPLLDEDGEPACPIIARSMSVDRENRRYGLVKRLIGPQDEINHRRSKALHMLSSVRVWESREGVIPDKVQFLDQLSRARGVASAQGRFGEDWGFLDNGEYAQGQLLLLQEAKAEIDNIGANASLAGKEDSDLSGRALLARQQGGLTELGPAFDALRDLKLRVYRACWERIKQFWDEERWIRVTDDERNVRFVGLNQQVTRGDLLLRQLQQAQAQGQPTGPVDVSDPSLMEVVGVERPIADMDVDIVISDAPDTVNIQAEQFELLVNLAQAYPQYIPPEMVIQASQLRDKDAILERLNDPQQAQKIAQAEQMEMAGKAAEIDLTQAKAEQARASAAEDAEDAQTPNESASARLDEARALKAEIEAEKAAVELFEMVNGRSRQRA